MGDTISSLVFRPPPPTDIDPNEFFYLDIDTRTPLVTRRDDQYLLHNCGSCMSLDNGEADLESLDRSFRAEGEYKVPAFFVRRRGAQHTILFSHGNAEDLGMMYKRMKELALVLCVNILAYDYTGYGISQGGNGPSENMIYRNIEAAYKYLRVGRQIPASHIILYGRSLGSGPSCYLAAKTAIQGDSVGGLILHSPFLSVYKVVADFGFDMAGDMFNNEKRAANIRCPTLIIHGKGDEVVPFWHAPRLLSAVPAEFRAHPLWVEDAGHNHIESKAKQPYLDAITTFLMRYVPVDTMGVYTKRGRVPNAVPEDERATSLDLQDCTTFYVNKTWLRHAKILFQEALAYKTTDTDSYKRPIASKRTVSFERRRRKVGRTRSRDVNRLSGIDCRDDEDDFAPWNAQPPRARPSPDHAHLERQNEAVKFRRSSSTKEFRRSNSTGAADQLAQKRQNKQTSLQLEYDFTRTSSSKRTQSKLNFLGKVFGNQGKMSSA